MRLDYEIKFMDYLKFQLMHSYCSFIVQLMFLIVPVTEFIGGVISGEYPIWIYLMSAIATYLVEIIVVTILLIIYFIFKADHILFTDQVVEFSEQGIHTHSKYAKCLYFWNKKTKVVGRMGNVCIYISANMAVLIPKRAFKSNEQRKEMTSFVKEMVIKSEL